MDLIKKLIRRGDIESLKDALVLIKDLESEGEQVLLDREYVEVAVKKNPENIKRARARGKELRKACGALMMEGSSEAADLYKESLKFDGRYDLDCAWRYAEWNRDNEKKFYEPRRYQLLPIVRGMERLENREINRLLVECPPGVGKTTLAEGFLVWTGSKHPELPNLLGSHSNSFLRGLYDELLRMLDPNGEYLWVDIFRQTVAGTNAKDMRIDLGTRKRFETYQLSSVGSGNAGKVRAGNILYLDDLVDGIESALSKERMDKLWLQYNTDYRQRMIGDCGELLIQTPWSLHDPIDRLEQMYENDPKTEVIKLPAMDSCDRSNFNYPYGLGFTTEFYREQRELMDDASWKALYMMQPIEREGQLYSKDEVNYFFDVPRSEADAIIAPCDSKEQGQDYLAMPIAKKFGDDYYIVKWICDNSNPDILEERVANACVEFNVKLLRVESNRGGTMFASNVKKLIKDKKGTTRVSTKWNQANKETRIIVSSGWVKKNVYFLDESLWDKEYRTAMNMLFSYTLVQSKRAHDDVPDVLADLEDMAEGLTIQSATVSRRIF